MCSDEGLLLVLQVAPRSFLFWVAHGDYCSNPPRVWRLYWRGKGVRGKNGARQESGNARRGSISEAESEVAADAPHDHLRGTPEQRRWIGLTCDVELSRRRRAAARRKAAGRTTSTGHNQRPSQCLKLGFALAS